MQMIIQNKDGEIVPGMVLADRIDTSVGRLTLVPDYRFTAVQTGGTFASSLYALRVFHNGEPINQLRRLN